jgi:NADH-quinone oxidoreductase subunit I
MKVTRPALSWWERTYFPAILKGMKLTFSHLFRKRVTLNYPEERMALPRGYRGAPILLTGLDGHEKCTSCKLCEFICPPRAIRIVAEETELEKEKRPKEFDIDMGLCIFCGYCQEVCPVEAIWLKDEYEMADYDRTNLIFNKEQLLARGRKPPYLAGKEKPLEEGA